MKCITFLAVLVLSSSLTFALSSSEQAQYWLRHRPNSGRFTGGVREAVRDDVTGRGVVPRRLNKASAKLLADMSDGLRLWVMPMRMTTAVLGIAASSNKAISRKDIRKAQYCTLYKGGEDALPSRLSTLPRLRVEKQPDAEQIYLDVVYGACAEIWRKEISDDDVSEAVVSPFSVFTQFLMGGWMEKGFIIPGTTWCGAGNASTSSSLAMSSGPLAELDVCCRAHDFCHHRVAAGDQSDAKGESFFDREDCSCDERFRRCLRRIRGPAIEVAKTVAKFYFKSGKMFCLRECPNYKCLRDKPRTLLEMLFSMKATVKYHLRGGYGDESGCFEYSHELDEEEPTKLCIFRHGPKIFD